MKTMTRIDLKNGYYIEIDTLNYTLRREYIGKNKDGNVKNAVKTCGYFPSVKQAVKRYIECVQLDVMDGERLSLEQYVETVEQVNKLAVQGLEDVLGRFPIK